MLRWTQSILVAPEKEIDFNSGKKMTYKNDLCLTSVGLPNLLTSCHRSNFNSDVCLCVFVRESKNKCYLEVM